MSWRNQMAFVIAGVNEHIKNVIACEQFGKIDKLLNVTYVYMFLNNLKVWLAKIWSQRIIEVGENSKQ